MSFCNTNQLVDPTKQTKNPNRTPTLTWFILHYTIINCLSQNKKKVHLQIKTAKTEYKEKIFLQWLPRITFFQQKCFVYFLFFLVNKFYRQPSQWLRIKLNSFGVFFFIKKAQEECYNKGDCAKQSTLRNTSVIMGPPLVLTNKPTSK